MSRLATARQEYGGADSGSFQINSTPGDQQSGRNLGLRYAWSHLPPPLTNQIETSVLESAKGKKRVDLEGGLIRNFDSKENSNKKVISELNLASPMVAAKDGEQMTSAKMDPVLFSSPDQTAPIQSESPSPRTNN